MKHLGFKIENLDDYSTGELYKFLSSKNETELARTAISILKNKLKIIPLAVALTTWFVGCLFLLISFF